MKAQTVKNAVIVPVGAKGGFVVKQPPTDGDALRAEVVECYRMFVSGLLDVTDNYLAGEVVPPPSTVRYDDDDPYLVVAADKGTATFSDIANQISADYGFWLGDAFASGGSVGYDHKAMGITARGAWESVRRHARAINKDADRHELRVIGIGDMSGDVFGNGLLSSPHLKLVAAFDHRHIFIDPNPDPAVSFAERQRLFVLPRSSWDSYNRALISDGGGVWPRTAKIIELSPQTRAALSIDAAALTPLELITAILKAPLDLLWNGGIGTYVKASTETNLDVGDRANDGLRVNGSDLRCKIVGEGGNLGFTQRGRVEYALTGGLIYTDAIDNSAGVDCSDHEVNIKILLNEMVESGDLTVKKRNEILAKMTDEIGELVLDDNRAQTLALAIARQQAAPMVNVHARYIHQLEVEGWMNRQLEYLPTDKQLAERQAAGQGLTTPEFAVLLAYTKLANIAELEATTTVATEPYLEADLVRYFPKLIRDSFPEAVLNHRLRDEIILTQVVNQMVNHSGISFDHRMTEETGATPGDVVLAWVAARDIFNYVELWDSIEALGSSVSMATQLDLFLEARRMIERSVMWLLRHRRPPLNIAATVEMFRTDMLLLMRELAPFVRGPLAVQTEALAASRIVAGVPGDLAEASAIWPLLHTSFDVIELARAHGVEPQAGAAAYWELVEHLDVTWLWNAIGALPRSDRWQTHARAAVRDDLLSALADLTGDVLAHGGAAATWSAANERAIARAQAVFAEIRRAGTLDLTTLSVALRQLRNLVLSTARAE
jgi:glutamate dehydrogenase